MATAFPSIAGLNLDAVAARGAATTVGARPMASRNDRLRAQAQDFEVQFVNSMFQQMYAGVEGDGPFGNSTGVGPWRSFLTEEYAKNFVKRGGIGIADSVYRSLLSMQEARKT
jgi:Rod binding domain-containing protein